MDDIDPRAAAVALLLIIAALIAWDNASGLLRGEKSLGAALTPSWVDFAAANPVLFAVLAVGGTLLLGGAFVRFLDAI